VIGTALGDFDIGIIARRGGLPGDGQVLEAAARARQVRDLVCWLDRLPVQLQDHIPDPVVISGAQDRIDLGHLGQDIDGITLGQAACDDQISGPSGRLFILCQLQDAVNGFLFCGFDKATCIDHQYIGLAGIIHHQESSLAQELAHALGINQILGTAKGKQENLSGFPRDRSVSRQSHRIR